MSVTHPTAVRTSIADFVVDKLDAGSAAAYIEFQTSGDVECATLEMDDPAFGGAVAGIATAGAIAPDTAATGGTIAKARFFDSDDNQIFACSVTASGGGGDIELSSVVVTAGQTVALTSLTYAAPA